MQKPNQISWKAPEFAYHEKSSAWYFAAALFALVILAYAVWRKDYLMFITLFVLSAVALALAKKRPKTFTITLSGEGIYLSRDLYPYKNLKYFWIAYQPPEIKTLGFETTSYLNREITVLLEDEDPNAIRDFLLQYLPEDTEREETFSDRLQRNLKL